VPGEILKKKREELGYNLKDIAKTLRLKSDYLKAIEEGTFEKLPVEVYTKGYIREYAKFLKTDPDSIIKAYLEKIAPPPAIEKKDEPSLPVENIVTDEKKPPKRPATAITFFVITAAVLLTSLFLFVFRTESPKAPASAMTAAIPPAPVLEPGTQAQEQKEIQKEKTSDIPSQPAGIKANGHSLEILASDTTWILVTIDKTESKELLLNKGGSAKFSAKKGFTLKIGNAGGVKLIFDGKDMGAPGESGKVITLNIPSENSPML